MLRKRCPEKGPACLDAMKECLQLQQEESMEDEGGQEKKWGDGQEGEMEEPAEELLAPMRWEPTGKYRRCELVGRDRKCTDNQEQS